MLNPARYQLVNLVMISNIDWNDFILSNDEFKRNSVLEIDRDAMQTVESSPKSVKSQRRVVWIYC